MIKSLVMKCCEQRYVRNGKHLFWSIKNSDEVLIELKSDGFLASSVSIFDLATLYTALHHNLRLENIY